MAVGVFDKSDTDYLQWRIEHPKGFVVNIRRRHDPTYVVLHRSSCPFVTSYPSMDRNPGGFTERSYRKICAASVTEVEPFLDQFFNGAVITVTNCSRCKPR